MGWSRKGSRSGTSSTECIRERTEYFRGSRISDSGDDKVLTRSRKRESGQPVAGHRLGEALIDLQTIIIVGLLYWLLREEQSNAYLRGWLSSNFPLGLYLLSPLTVVAISGTLLVITVFRIAFFVTGKDSALVGGEVLYLLRRQGKHLRELVSTEVTSISALVLASSGAALTLYSYFIIHVVPFTALGISCIILGFTIISLPRHTGGGPGMRAMLQGASLGVEALLEQYNVEKATYLPPVEGGEVFAYVPLTPDIGAVSLSEMRRAPKTLSGNGQRAMLVYPVGSELGKIPEFQDGLSLEERLKYILIESTEICSRVMVEETGNAIVVGMEGAYVDIQGQKYRKSLGSLPSSIAACVIAALHDKPVTLLEERKMGDRLIARFQLLE